MSPSFGAYGHLGLCSDRQYLGYISECVCACVSHFFHVRKVVFITWQFTEVSLLHRAVGSNSIMVRPKKGEHQSIRILALCFTIDYIQILLM